MSLSKTTDPALLAVLDEIALHQKGQWRSKDIKTYTGYSEQTIRRYIKERDFPKPLGWGKQGEPNMWNPTKVRAWVAKQHQQAQKEQATQQRALNHGTIYIIGPKGGGPVKVGWTTDLEQRLKAIQTGHPEELSILFAFSGSVYKETEIHQEWKSLRIRGEWFSRNILQYLKTRYVQQRSADQ